MSSDWRRSGQEAYLQGAVFTFRVYVAPRPGWDHDHCEFCMAKFSPDDLTSGWATPYEGETDNFRWVCQSCFEDFREEFEFRVEV
jgi:hypothetical protein